MTFRFFFIIPLTLNVTPIVPPLQSVISSGSATKGVSVALTCDSLKLTRIIQLEVPTGLLSDFEFDIVVNKTRKKTNVDLSC